jgi:hypothetical protein
MIFRMSFLPKYKANLPLESLMGLNLRSWDEAFVCPTLGIRKPLTMRVLLGEESIWVAEGRSIAIAAMGCQVRLTIARMRISDVRMDVSLYGYGLTILRRSNLVGC